MTQRDHMINQLRADIRRETGREYRVEWEQLDDIGIREMMRLLIDLSYEKNRAVVNERARARRLPWLVK